MYFWNLRRNLCFYASILQLETLSEKYGRLFAFITESTNKVIKVDRQPFNVTHRKSTTVRHLFKLFHFYTVISYVCALL